MSSIPTKAAAGVSIPIRMVLAGPMELHLSLSINTICRSNEILWLSLAIFTGNFFWMRRVVVVILLFPVVFLACSPNNVTVDDSLGRYFDSAGVKGTFGLFDNGHGHFTIYNLSRYSDSFYSPGATFDILLSLVGIQMGVVKDESAKLLPDTVMKVENRQPENFGELFRDTTVFDGLAFFDLSLRIGMDTVKKWIDSLQYGNKEMGKDAADDL